MAEEVSCLYCGHTNQTDAMFCEACSRVLEDPETLDDQERKTYLDQEDILITETSAFLHGKTYSIAEIEEVDITEKKKGSRTWGMGLIFVGLCTIIEGLLEGEYGFSLSIGFLLLFIGVLVAALTKPIKEEMLSTLWIKTKDGSENSLTLVDQEEAEAIKQAILQSLSDQ